MDKQKSISLLQFIVTGLAQGAFVHKLQGQVFKAQGWTKLAEKYAEHYTEEMEWVEKCVERILDLGGDVKVEAQEAATLVSDPVAYIREDLRIQEMGVEMLRKGILSVAEDITTFDLLKDYLKDEEEDLYWMEAQLELISKIDEKNWLLQQL